MTDGPQATLGLSEDERAELAQLRSEKASQPPPPDPDAPPKPTHYLHLADGQIVESAGVATHYNGQVVVNAVPISEG
jgi:hypothetical protein